MKQLHAIKAYTRRQHGRSRYLQKLPLNVIVVITVVAAVNVLVWASVGIVLVGQIQSLIDRFQAERPRSIFMGEPALCISPLDLCSWSKLKRES